LISNPISFSVVVSAFRLEFGSVLGLDADAAPLIAGLIVYALKTLYGAVSFPTTAWFNLSLAKEIRSLSMRLESIAEPEIE
jgi:hypothetical protein